MIGFGFAPVVWIIAAIGAVYFVLVILGKIVLFFCEIFGEIYGVIFIEPKRAHPKIRVEEVKRFPKEVREHNEKEVKECNEKVDKITDLTLTLGFLAIVFLSVLITAAG